MNSNQTLSLDEQIQELLSAALQVPLDEITDDVQFGDLPQWDSMGHMEVMISLEEKYGIEVSADTIATLTSFEAIRQYIQENNYGSR